MNDKALYEALRQQSVQTSRQLPSNFAFNTLRRIERERQVRERHEKIVAVITVAACSLFGFGAITYYYGDTLLHGLASMTQHSESYGILPGLAFCCLFLAVFNSFLRRKFA